MRKTEPNNMNSENLLAACCELGSAGGGFFVAGGHEKGLTEEPGKALLQIDIFAQAVSGANQRQ